MTTFYLTLLIVSSKLKNTTLTIITFYVIQYFYLLNDGVKHDNVSQLPRVSVQGVESLWGDCRLIPTIWGA